jgi:hypothetical protein
MDRIGWPPFEVVSLTVTGAAVKTSRTDTSSPCSSGKKAPSGSMFRISDLDRSFRMTN